jgi:hypothetical protein
LTTRIYLSSSLTHVEHDTTGVELKADFVPFGVNRIFSRILRKIGARFLSAAVFLFCRLKQLQTFSRRADSPIQFYSKVNNVFCLSLLGLLDSNYGPVPSRALSDRNVL